MSSLSSGPHRQAMSALSHSSLHRPVRFVERNIGPFIPVAQRSSNGRQSQSVLTVPGNNQACFVFLAGSDFRASSRQCHLDVAVATGTMFSAVQFLFHCTSACRLGRVMVRGRRFPRGYALAQSCGHSQHKGWGRRDEDSYLKTRGGGGGKGSRSCGKRRAGNGRREGEGATRSNFSHPLRRGFEHVYLLPLL